MSLFTLSRSKPAPDGPLTTVARQLVRLPLSTPLRSNRWHHRSLDVFSHKRPAFPCGPDSRAAFMWRKLSSTDRGC
eukprot:3933012-Rhodomonas_salina.1